ncbi:MAG: hypothetical protein ACJ741_20730 [Pyrinomonadaceae bacterium]
MAALGLFGAMPRPARVAAQAQPLRVTANFSAQKPVAPDARLELQTARAPLPGEGRLAVFVGETDVTALCAQGDNRLTYQPQPLPLPLGETSVVVYLVSQDNQWTEIARLPLLVEEPKPAGAPAGTAGRQPPPSGQTGEARPFQFVPRVSVNVKAQSVVLFFPESSRPQRINFTDLALQASLQGNYNRDGVSALNEFDLAGSTVQNEALRFPDLGREAMQVDLSSYLMQFQIHKVKLRVGQISFGSSRQLINNFTSRGVFATVPLTRRFDLSGAFMNGTSIVGFDNFFGLSRAKHRLFSGTLGVELLPQRPGGFRVELSALKGALLPRSSFNQANVNDAERSRGASVRVSGSDKRQRLRFDGGFARSLFTNPADPLLYQGRHVVPVRPVSRGARFLDISYDLLRGYKLTESKPVNLALAFRHEKVDPLYRSIAAFAQADRFNNEWTVNGSVGDITFTADDTRGSDDLAGIRSILKTLTRRQAFSLSLPAATLFGGPKKPSAWLPRLSFGFDRTHQLAAFVPVGGDFSSLSQIPNQVSTNQSFAAEWQFSSALRLGYRFNYSFQDNRQITSERADLLDETNGLTVGLNPSKSLDLNFEVGTERASNFAQNAINTTLRVGTGVTWRMTGRMVWALNASTTGAGDRFGASHRRDADFDVQYSWRFLQSEKSRWKKVQGQFFIRYANRYGLARDRLFGFNTLTKFQAFNAGLNFNFF